VISPDQQNIEYSFQHETHVPCRTGSCRTLLATRSFELPMPRDLRLCGVNTTGCYFTTGCQHNRLLLHPNDRRHVFYASLVLTYGSDTARCTTRNDMPYLLGHPSFISTKLHTIKYTRGMQTHLNNSKLYKRIQFGSQFLGHRLNYFLMRLLAK
jgi:hypothetical protein